MYIFSAEMYSSCNSYLRMYGLLYIAVIYPYSTFFNEQAYQYANARMKLWLVNMF